MKKNRTPKNRAEECIKAWHDTGEDTDIQGSYTGIFKYTGAPENFVYSSYDGVISSDELKPVQDADDL